VEQVLERRAHGWGDPRSVSASFLGHRYFQKELSCQGGACGEPGKQEAAEVKRTFDRRGCELRLAARPRLVLPRC
jgi:hypothetical protein